MATLVPQNLVRQAVLAPSYASAAGGGDKFNNDGTCFIHLKNTNAAVRVVTIAWGAGITVDGTSGTPRTYTVPALTGDVMIGPFPPHLYNDANGQVALTYDAVTNLSIAVLSVRS